MVLVWTSPWLLEEHTHRIASNLKIESFDRHFPTLLFLNKWRNSIHHHNVLFRINIFIVLRERPGIDYRIEFFERKSNTPPPRFILSSLLPGFSEGMRWIFATNPMNNNVTYQFLIFWGFLVSISFVLSFSFFFGTAVPMYAITSLCCYFIPGIHHITVQHSNKITKILGYIRSKAV